MFCHTLKWIATITCICISASTSSAEQSKTDSLFSLATETLNDGHLSKSIKAFKRVLSVDDRYAPALEQIARLHLQQDTPNSRRVAEKVIRRAFNGRISRSLGCVARGSGRF